MSDSDTDLKQTIADSATKPIFAQGDQIAVRQQDLTQVIEADKYLRALDAAKKPSKLIRYARFVPGCH